MNLKHLVLYLMMGGLLLVACTGSPEESSSSNSAQAGSAETAVQPSTTDQETVPDEQGAVTPLNLADEAATLAFEVAMNTRSVDLSMDLATLATLTTDAARPDYREQRTGTIPGGDLDSGVGAVGRGTENRCDTAL